MRSLAQLVDSMPRLSLGARREISNRSPVPLSRRMNGWQIPGMGRGDMRAYMEAYGQDAVLFPIVARLAESTAKQEWKLWTKADTKEDRTAVKGHAVLDLLEHPNQFMSRMELMEQGQQYADLVGETDLAVGYAGGIKYPLDLWPMRPDRLEPQPDPYDYLLGWIYRGPNGEQVPLKLSEILRFRLPNPLDPYRGMGPVQALLLDLDAQRFGREWQAMFFQNSARPGGVIEVDRRLSDPEFNEMAMRWREQHQGISKSHRVAIIEHGAKWVETSFSMRDLQFAELDGVARDKTLVAFGFPKSMLGIVEDVNRANAEAGEYMFGKWLIEPRLDRWKGMFNHQLLPLFDKALSKKVELDYESPVPENSEQAMAELAIKSEALMLLTADGRYDAAKVLDLLQWPDLGYTPAPPPPAPIIAPPPAPGAPAPAKKAAPAVPEDSLEAAMRWVVKGEDDDNACEPCKGNHGKTYRNRQSAYADYPGGDGYIKCVGAEYGNKCRCSVVKRKQS